jgi:hypothetical protein
MPEKTDRRGPIAGRRLLGQVLVDGEFITPFDLARALEEQKRTNVMLGEALVRLGVIDPIDLKAALSVQGELGSIHDAIRVAAGVRMLLGELLLAAKRITPGQLDAALDEQRRTGDRIGEILARRGWITRAELDAVLAFQQHQGGEGPSSERLRLGEILVATGQITRARLDAALLRTRTSPKRIGDLLVEAGDLRPEQVDRGLRIQKMLVTASLVAVLSLASAAETQDVSRAGPGPSAARVEVSARVQATATLRVLWQQARIAITDADILRGYVDVRSASRIEMRNNSVQGFMLVFEAAEGPFREVYVRGLGREVQLGSGGGFAPMPYSQGPVVVELSYRFMLNKEIRAGVYDWPLVLSSRPI